MLLYDGFTPQHVRRAIWTILAAAAFASSMLPLAADGQSDQIGSTDPAEHMEMQEGTDLPAIQYGIGHIEDRVQSAVMETVQRYTQEGAAAFHTMTPEAPQYTHDIHPFVINGTTLEYVADGSGLHGMGDVEDGLQRADRPLDVILDDIRNDGSAWAEYISTNPDNGEREFQRVWLHEHDGYLFGAGYYIQDARAQDVVHQALELYMSEGSRAFEIITPDEIVTTAALYPFIVNATIPELPALAHGVNPELIGRSATAAISGTSDRPFEDVMVDLRRDGGTWVEYIYRNPDTGTDQLKRTWLYLYGDLVFASGYYIPDSRAQTLAAEAIRLYDIEGDGAFGIMTPDEPAYSSGSYPFVIDAESFRMEAHGAFPYLVDARSHYLDAADKPLIDILNELDEYGEAWVSYVSENPGTRTDQLTRSYLKAHDGHIFGAGYSLPDSRALSKVDEAIYTYRADPDPTFADINAGALNEFGLVPLVSNSTTILAHGALPVVGYQLSPTNVEDVLNITIAFSKPIREHMLLALEADGQEYWFREIGVNPYHGMSLINNYVTRSYDGLAFTSSYFVSEGDVQSRADLALFSYAENGRAAFEAITPDEPVTTDESYPFVLNATTLEVVAYGASPDVVGTIYDSIRDTSIRAFDEVLADIERDGYTWVIHTAVNPITGKEQLKQSWLQERDGYIFGAGYYIIDASARDTSSYFILVYEHAPILLNFPFPLSPGWLWFVVDPITGLTHPGNDMSAPWAAIAAEVPAGEIIRALEKEPGMWVTYRAVNPLNDMEEDARVWMTLHDGYVFGTVFYETGWRPNP